jgi:hypothetical protein
MTLKDRSRIETIAGESALVRPDGGPVGSVRQSRSNILANKMRDEDRPFHDWYRFVLSFPPHFIRDYLARLGLDRRQTVLDPFCGTGTTLVECKKLGIPSCGVEGNPMAHFASAVKTDWSPDPKKLLCHAEAVADQAAKLLASNSLGLAKSIHILHNGSECLRTLSPEEMALILRDSISPLPLHKVLILRDCILESSAPEFRRQDLLALAKTVVLSASNLKFGPEVGVGPQKNDAPVVEAWLEEVRKMSVDLQEVWHRNPIRSDVYKADSRRIDDTLPPHSIDGVLTSPPYPNEKDYTRTTRLESVLLGFLGSRDDLRSLKRHMVRSNTRGVYKGDDDDQWVAGFPRIQQIAMEIERRRIEMGKTSGFERLYPRVTKLYFGAMARHLASLRPCLRKGARLAYVVGDQASYLRVMIRTGEILAEIADSLGYEVVSIDLFRTRLATATKEQLREEVVVLSWKGGHD